MRATRVRPKAGPSLDGAEGAVVPDAEHIVEHVGALEQGQARAGALDARQQGISGDPGRAQVRWWVRVAGQGGAL